MDPLEFPSTPLEKHIRESKIFKILNYFSRHCFRKGEGEDEKGPESGILPNPKIKQFFFNKPILEKYLTDIVLCIFGKRPILGG